MIVIGIDVGFSGAIAILNNTKIKDLIDMPILKVSKKTHLDANRVKNIMIDSKAEHVFIEKAQAMPKQGIASTASYMKSAGIIEGVCVGLGIPYTLVTPQAWKKEMMQGMGKEKEASIFRAKQLYPDIDFPRKKDHGKADALLIALYGTRVLCGNRE